MEKSPKVSEQGAKFIATAKDIGCDESDAAFKERLKNLVSVPPTSLKKPSKPKRHKASK